MIDQYSFGSMTILGKEYRSDLTIINGRVASGWWRKAGHLVGISDLEGILAVHPQSLVIGTGSAGLMKVGEQLEQHLAICAVELVAMPTAQAVEIFNQFHAAGQKVSGAFHLTC